MTDQPVEPAAPAALAARLRAAGCVYAEDEASLLLASGRHGLGDRIARRIAGEPLEQVLGWAEFDGLRVVVEPGVFVPRQRSRLLAELAARRARAGTVVLDLCCGSGAIGAAIAHRVPGVLVYAADLDPRAVACARRNLVAEHVFPGDLWDALPERLRGRVDIVVANAPYVPSAEVVLMPREAREHESRAALDGGADGLDWHRRIAEGAMEWLAPGGLLLIETSDAQAPTTMAILRSAGWSVEIVRDDDVDATAARAEYRSGGETG